MYQVEICSGILVSKFSLLLIWIIVTECFIWVIVLWLLFWNWIVKDCTRGLSTKGTKYPGNNAQFYKCNYLHFWKGIISCRFIIKSLLRLHFPILSLPCHFYVEKCRKAELRFLRFTLEHCCFGKCVVVISVIITVITPKG